MRGPASCSASLAVVTLAAPAAAQAAAPTFRDTADLRRDVGALGILGHETALQAIAPATKARACRARSGYDASARYVVTGPAARA